MKELIPILLQYIKSRQKPGGHVILVAHNARTFDVPFLVNEFSRCSFEIPPDWLFVDTLPLSREAMKSGGLSHSLYVFVCACVCVLVLTWFWFCENRIKGFFKSITSSPS